MAKLIVFRHAESVYGSEIYAGNVDIPLSHKGIKQAFELSPMVCSFNIDIVYTSKLIRSTETALIMLTDESKTIARIFPNELDTVIKEQRFLPLLELSELNERNYGDLQNKSKKQALELYSLEEIQNWRRGFYAAPPSGERFCDVVDRVRKFMIEYVFPYIDDFNILVVAHQNTMRAIYYLLMNQSPKAIEKIEFYNCEGIQFNIKNGKVESVLLNHDFT